MMLKQVYRYFCNTPHTWRAGYCAWPRVLPGEPAVVKPCCEHPQAAGVVAAKCTQRTKSAVSCLAVFTHSNLHMQRLSAPFHFAGSIYKMSRPSTKAGCLCRLLTALNIP